MYYERLSTVGERLVAFIVDHVIFSVLFAIAIISTAISEYLFIFVLLVPILYLFKDCIGGRSIGKRIMGIGVRDAVDVERDITPFKSFIRNVMLIIWPLEFMVLIFSTVGQRIGDRIAKTVVVKLNSKKTENYTDKIEEYNNKISTSTNKSVGKVLGIIIGGFIAFVLTIIIIAFSFIKGSGAYEASINHIEEMTEVREQIGEIEGYGFIPTGSISITNGEGEARLTIKVKGDLGNAYVTCYCRKEPGGNWQVLEYWIRP